MSACESEREYLEDEEVESERDEREQQCVQERQRVREEVQCSENEIVDLRKIVSAQNKKIEDLYD